MTFSERHRFIVLGWRPFAPVPTVKHAESFPAAIRGRYETRHVDS